MEVDPAVFRYALDTIIGAKTQRQLNKLLFELRDHYQLANIVYHAARIEGVVRKNPILLLTYDPQWIQEYTKRNLFEIDPVVIEGRQSSLPLDWNDVDRDTAQARKFFKQADSFGVGRQGYTMPIRTHEGDTALFTFTANVKDEEWKTFRAKRKAELLFIGQYFHEKAVEIGGYRNAPEQPYLTPQELKCLQYLVDGHTPKDIARITDLSIATVRLHLNNARLKLSAATQHEAAATAMRLRLVRR